MYNEFYGFSERPFEVTPDPRFLYFTPSHREALATMIKGIKNRWGFVCITGEVGTGKTTLIHALLNRPDEKVRIVFIFHTLMTFRELLKDILLQLDPKVLEKSKEGLLSLLVEYLKNRLARDETLVVIIDEAQNLSEDVMEEIGRLSELKPQISVRLQIIFVGQPEFETKLNSQGLKQLNQRIGIRRQIKALSKEESIEYIEHRLKIVGGNRSEMFTPKAISMIIHYGQGIPRVINILCDNALRVGCVLSRKKIDVDVIREAIRIMEGPTPQKAILLRIGQIVREFRLPSLRNDLSPRRIFFILLTLLCVGGIILLMHGFSPRKPLNMRNIESIQNRRIDTKPSSGSSFHKTTTEQTSKVDRRDSAIERESAPIESPQHVVPPSASSMAQSPKDILKEVVIVKEGQTVSSLAQKYYRMVNTTLVDLILDFNPEITNADLIQVDQKIKIPQITEERLIVQSSDRTYRIHVGTFFTPEFAKLYKEEPLLKEKEIEILPKKISPQDTLYRVVVGKFSDKDEVLKVISLLKEKDLLPLFGGNPKIE
jgi:general secretion pathway protein A